MAPFARDLGTVLRALEARPQARPSRRWRRHPERLKRVIERALPGDGELFSELEPPRAFELAEWDDGDPVVALREHYDRAAAEVKSAEPSWARHPDMPFQDSSRLETLHIRYQPAPGSGPSGATMELTERRKVQALYALGVLICGPASLAIFGGTFIAILGGYVYSGLMLVLIGVLLLIPGLLIIWKAALLDKELDESASSPADHEDWTADDRLFVEEVELFMAA